MATKERMKASFVRRLDGKGIVDKQLYKLEKTSKLWVGNESGSVENATHVVTVEGPTELPRMTHALAACMAHDGDLIIIEPPIAESLTYGANHGGALYNAGFEAEYPEGKPEPYVLRTNPDTRTFSYDLPNSPPRPDPVLSELRSNRARLKDLSALLTECAVRLQAALGDIPSQGPGDDVTHVETRAFIAHALRVGVLGGERSTIHPMQPIVKDANGVVRFKKNQALDRLFNEEPRLLVRADRIAAYLPPEDVEQLYQLLGDKVSEYGDLPYVRPESAELADAIAHELFDDHPTTPEGEHDDSAGRPG